MLRDLNVSTSGRRVCGTPKLGVRGAAIPSTGQHGPSIIYPSLSLPADANKFYRARILTWPAQGVLRVYEDGSLDYDGTGVFEPQTFTFQLYEGNKFKGTARVEFVHDTMCSAILLNVVEGAVIRQGDNASTQL